METKHTPGPWKKAERLNGPWWHISADYGLTKTGSGRQAVACVHGVSKRQGESAYSEMFEANARLIAAAPDLLKALQRLVPINDIKAAPEAYAQEWHEALAAIVKATTPNA